MTYLAPATPPAIGIAEPHQSTVAAILLAMGSASLYLILKRRGWL